MRSKVAIKFCPDYDLDRLQEVLSGLLSLVGGPQAIFKANSSVLIKPNLLRDARPEDGITTHPNFIRAIVRILKKAKLEVAIADIPGEHKLEVDLEKVYRITGMKDAAEKEGVRLLTQTKFIEEDGVIFSSWVREFDYIVSAPKFKTHALMTLTGAVKNVFGLTPRLYRINLHKRFIHPDDFAAVLLDVYKKCRPAISFVDGIVAMEGNGPASAGKLRDLGLVAVSDDGLALDSVLSRIMGLEPDEVTTNRQGGLLGLGITNLDEIEIRGDDIGGFLKRDFELPPTALPLRLPKGVLKFLAERLAKSKPKVDKSSCNGCRICVENCPLAAIDIYDKKAQIDYKKCVDCFCCLEVCPKGSMKMSSGPLIHTFRFLYRSRNILKKFRRKMTW